MSKMEHQEITGPIRPDQIDRDNKNFITFTHPTEGWTVKYTYRVYECYLDEQYGENYKVFEKLGMSQREKSEFAYEASGIDYHGGGWPECSEVNRQVKLINAIYAKMGVSTGTEYLVGSNKMLLLT